MITDLIKLGHMSTLRLYLETNSLDLWHFSLNKNLAEAEAILSKEELEQASRFYFEKHQRRFRTARTTLKQILAAYLGVSAQEINFFHNKHGKPALPSEFKLAFNLSHTEEEALLAVSSLPVGVDIERFSARPYEGIAESLFSEAENERLKSIGNRQKAALFFQIWTQKEAFIKACGLGLSYPTKDFTVPKEKEGFVEDKLHGERWKILRFMPKIALSASLCYHPSILSIRNFTWNNSRPYNMPS